MTQTDNDKPRDGLHLDFDNVTVNGNFGVAGRDVSISTTNYGDVAQRNQNTITVGGVETTEEDYQHLLARIAELEEKIEAEDVDEETKEAARHFIKNIKDMLLAKKRPNPKILIDSVKSLAKLGPFFAAGIATVFGEPLAEQIIQGLGGSTSSFFRVLRSRFGV